MKIAYYCIIATFYDFCNKKFNRLSFCLSSPPVFVFVHIPLFLGKSLPKKKVKKKPSQTSESIGAAETGTRAKKSRSRTPYILERFFARSQEREMDATGVSFLFFSFFVASREKLVPGEFFFFGAISGYFRELCNARDV